MIVIQYKQGICEKLIESAKIYKSVFMGFEYLIYSKKFVHRPYYIISAIEGNFSHLAGIKTLIPASSFYFHCINGTLHEAHFDFKDDKFVKGTIRRKLKAFSDIPDFFLRPLIAEENFSKGKAMCAFGSSNGKATIGFTRPINMRPMTLLMGNCLDPHHSVDVSLVLKRKKGESMFNEVMQCACLEFATLYPDLMDLRE